jgi:hypothetical protein
MHYTVYKFALPIMLLYFPLHLFAQSPANARQFNDINSFTHATLKKGQECLLAAAIYGGGLFEVKEKGNYKIDSGIVFPTADTNLLLVRKMKNIHVVEMAWYNVKDSIHNFMPAFKKATAYLNTINGGTILFDAGTFLAEPFFTIDANNITVEGADENKTFIKVSDKATQGLMINSNYRDAGWLLNADDLITYQDNSVKAGNSFIDLKVADDSKKLVPGTIVFINGGANYFDQNYGEFNTVDHCTTSGRVYLKYKLSRSYEQSISSWAATLTNAFKPPAEDASASIQFSGTQPRAGTTISIGNDLYKVVSSTASTAVVINVKHKGNSTNIISAGTPVFRFRAITLAPSVVHDVNVKNITITGRRNALTVSNTFKTNFENVRLNWLPQPMSPGGLWLDGDDGRDFTMKDCDVNCTYLYTAQFARSFADIYISNTHFKQAGIQFSEYNINANVDHCIFDLTYNNLPGENNISLILLGNTCSSINFSNNIVHANNIRLLFNSNEIQDSKAVISSNINISSNTIICNNVGTVFTGTYAGNVIVQNNNISGDANFLFALHAVKGDCIVKSNVFTGKVDGFAAAMPNAEYSGNIVKRTGASSKPVEYNAWGNVLYTHIKPDTTVDKFIFKDNKFYNWNLQHNSFSHYWPLNKNVAISNNHFYNNSADSVVTLTR